jgi:hypothetical protein
MYSSSAKKAKHFRTKMDRTEGFKRKLGPIPIVGGDSLDSDEAQFIMDMRWRASRTHSCEGKCSGCGDWCGLELPTTCRKPQI